MIHDSPESLYHKILFRLTTGLWMVFLVLCLLFIFTKNYPVFDDPFNIKDVSRYASKGINLTTIRQHANPAGIGSYIWIGGIGGLLGGTLLTFRLAVWLSWLLIFVSFILLQRKLQKPENQIFTIVSLFLLSNTYSLNAGATLLTEATALQLALFGFGLIVFCFSHNHTRISEVFVFLTASFFLGLAAISRIYYVALIPALYVLVFLRFFQENHGIRKMIFCFTAGLLSIIPVLFLILVWGGLTPPMLKVAYPMFSSGIAFNLNRAFPPVLYLGLYALPVWILAGEKKFFKFYHLIFPVLLITLISIQKIYIWRMGVDFVGTGLVDNLISTFQKRNEFAGLMLNLGFMFLGSYSFSVIGEQVYLKGKEILVQQKWAVSDTAFVFSALILVLLILEQICIGGNISFYERYMLQIYPFLGFVLFGFVKINYRILTWLLISFSIAVFMLYRN